MKKKLLLVSTLLIMLAYTVSAASGGINNDSNRKVIDPGQSVAELHEIEGEVMAINANFLTITEKKVAIQLRLAPQVKIYCNGLAASWKALLPVTAAAFFDARVVLNKQNEVILLDGFYQGDECIIEGWQKTNAGLCLELTSLNNGQDLLRLVKSEAFLPMGHWLIVGQLVYVLYDQQGAIRAVYLPD